MIRRLRHPSVLLIIHSCAQQGRPKDRCRGRRADGRQRGFTLLELIVVLVVIGIMVSMATLSFGVLGRDRQSEEETRRFWAVLAQAREEAELQTADLGVFVTTTAYEYLRFEPRRNEWLPIADDPLFEQRKLPDGLRFRLRVESREIVLSPSMPDRSDKDQDKKDGDEDKDENKKWPPQMMVLSSGDVMPFELEIEREGAPSMWRVTALADNDLRVENRDERNEWGPVLQTKKPPEDPNSAKSARVSNAR